jgi:hypothetical protein
MPISAKATAGAVAVALMALAPAAHAAELLSHPRSVERAEVVSIDWSADEAAEAPAVVVERRNSLFWVEEDADLVLEDTGERTWSARWRPGYYSPSGTYRIRVQGTGYELTSEDFRVRPCECLIAAPMRSKWRDGGYRLRVTAQYAASPLPNFDPLPTRVVTGRPLVRVWRDGQRVGSARLRYRRGAFRGSWNGTRGPRHATVFELVSLRDAFGNG